MNSEKQGKRKKEKLIDYLNSLKEKGFEEEEIGLIYLNFLVDTSKKKLVSGINTTTNEKYIRAVKREFVEYIRKKFGDLVEKDTTKNEIYEKLSERKKFLSEKSQIIYGLESIASNSFGQSIESTLLTKLKEDDVSFEQIGNALIKGAEEYANAIKKTEKYFMEYQRIAKYFSLAEENGLD